MVCILLSTYNGERFLEQQLDSILNQQGVACHLLVRDDGSSDGTVAILQRYKERYSKQIIEVIVGENCGFAQSFGALVKRAYELYTKGQTYDYYAFADQDDYWQPLKISRAVELLSRHNAELPTTYCSNCTLVDQELKEIGYFRKRGEWKVKKGRALIENIATGCTMVFNPRALALYALHAVPEVKLHDCLMYQLCTFLGEVVYDNDSYILYRQHGGNQIGTTSVWEKWRRRLLGNLFTKRNVLDTRAQHLLSSFAELLSEEDIRLITKLAEYRKNIGSRWRLLTDREIKFSTFEANALMVIKVLTGKL